MTSIDHRKKVAGTVAALFAVLIWSGWIPVTRLGVVGSLTPADVAALRYGTAGCVLLPYFWMHRHRIPWNRPGLLMLIAGGAGVPYFAFFGMGLRLANTGQAAVFGPGASSLFTILLARLWLNESVTMRWRIGFACSMLGFAGVIIHDLISGGGRLMGFGLILLASLAWATFTVASRRLALPPLLTAAFVGVINAVLYLPYYGFTGGAAHLQAAPWGSIALQAAYQGVLTGTIAMVAFTFAVSRLGAAGAAAFIPMTPVMATLFGWWILNDHVDGPTAAGLAAVALGVVISNGAWRRPTAP